MHMRVCVHVSVLIYACGMRVRVFICGHMNGGRRCWLVRATDIADCKASYDEAANVATGRPAPCTRADEDRWVWPVAPARPHLGTGEHLEVLHTVDITAFLESGNVVCVRLRWRTDELAHTLAWDAFLCAVLVYLVRSLHAPDNMAQTSEARVCITKAGVRANARWQ